MGETTCRLLTFKTPELLHFKTELSIQRHKTAVSVRFGKKTGFGTGFDNRNNTIKNSTTICQKNQIYFSCSYKKALFKLKTWAIYSPCLQMTSLLITEIAEIHIKVSVLSKDIRQNLNKNRLWKKWTVSMSIILALIAAFGASVDGTRYGAASMASYGTARVTSRKSLSLRHRKSDAVGRCWNVKGIGSAYIHYHSDISLFTSYFVAEA